MDPPDLLCSFPDVPLMRNPRPSDWLIELRTVFLWGFVFFFGAENRSSGGAELVPEWRRRGGWGTWWTWRVPWERGSNWGTMQSRSPPSSAAAARGSCGRRGSQRWCSGSRTRRKSRSTSTAPKAPPSGARASGVSASRLPTLPPAHVYIYIAWDTRRLNTRKVAKFIILVARHFGLAPCVVRRGIPVVHMHSAPSHLWKHDLARRDTYTLPVTFNRCPCVLMGPQCQNARIFPALRTCKTVCPFWKHRNPSWITRETALASLPFPGWSQLLRAVDLFLLS